MDYDIQLNDVIQLMIKVMSNDESTKENFQTCTSKSSKLDDLLDVHSQYYKVGDLIDVRLADTGAWYEANITKIFKKVDEKSSETHLPEEDLYFRIKR